MALEPHQAVFLLAGTVMLGLAAWVLRLEFGNRLHQALALFLIFRGIFNLELAWGVGGSALAWRLLPYAQVAVLAAALHFVFTFRRERARMRRATIASACTWLLAAAAMAAYLVDHGLWAQAPLEWVPPLRVLSYLAIAVLLAWDAVTSQVPSDRTALLAASLGFAFAPLQVATQLVAAAAFDASTPLLPASWSSTYAWVVGATAALAALLAWILLARMPAASGRAGRGYLAAVSLAPLSVLFVYGLYRSQPPTLELAYLVVDGAWTVAVPALLGYAIVRHRLFDLDLRAHWAVQRTTVVALVMAVFLVASELAQSLLDTTLSYGVGGLVSAVFLVALFEPLERLAKRLAEAAIPLGDAPQALDPKGRRAVYTDMARIAWLDGRISAGDRRYLDAARRRLGLRSAEAQQLERRAQRVAGAPRAP